LLTALVPALTHAQSTLDSLDRNRRVDAELAFGLALFGTGYAGAILWAHESEGDQDALYVPLLGPWLELFDLPDCADRDLFCAHGNATRSVLLIAGASQLVGTGLALHALLDRDEQKPVLIAPVIAADRAGVSVSGRF
jgi:hypothetical protein